MYVVHAATYEKDEYDYWSDEDEFDCRDFSLSKQSPLTVIPKSEASRRIRIKKTMIILQDECGLTFKYRVDIHGNILHETFFSFARLHVWRQKEFEDDPAKPHREIMNRLAQFTGYRIARQFAIAAIVLFVSILLLGLCYHNLMRWVPWELATPDDVFCTVVCGIGLLLFLRMIYAVMVLRSGTRSGFWLVMTTVLAFPLLFFTPLLMWENEIKAFVVLGLIMIWLTFLVFIMLQYQDYRDQIAGFCKQSVPDYNRLQGPHEP